MTGEDLGIAVQRWIAALRSGDYEQTRWVLRFYDSYSAIGVLCDVLTEWQPDVYWWDAEERIVEDGWAGVGTIAPHTIRRAFHPTFWGEVARRNDLGQVSFSLLADWIAAAWKEYVT